MALYDQVVDYLRKGGDPAALDLALAFNLGYLPFPAPDPNAMDPARSCEQCRRTVKDFSDDSGWSKIEAKGGAEYYCPLHPPIKKR